MTQEQHVDVEIRSQGTYSLFLAASGPFADTKSTGVLAAADSNEEGVQQELPLTDEQSTQCPVLNQGKAGTQGAFLCFSNFLLLK